MPRVTGSRSAAQRRTLVLLADHNADFCRYIERLLATRYQVEVAPSGEVALRTARANPPDLILAELMVPRLDGLGLLRELRADERTQDVPVILLSARAGHESRDASLQEHAADYLLKPFSERELLARIEARLEISRVNRADVERERQLRASAELSEARMRSELQGELAAMSRLHQLSTRWLAGGALDSLLLQVLDASMELLVADFGHIQLFDPESQVLKIVAQRGFGQEFFDYLASMHEGTGSGAAAVQARSRIVIEDVLTDPAFAPHRTSALAAGFRALQSTPLISRGGELLGVLSAYFAHPQSPTERKLRLLDLYARQAADLIEHRRAEEKLRRCEERFRRYFDLGLIGGALTSPEKGCLEVNDELCRILGYPREELLQKSWAELTHPDDLAADVAQFERVMAGEIDSYTLEKRWICKDGGVVDSVMTARAVRRVDGTVDYFVGLVQDITARKCVEESMQRLQADLAHVSRVALMGEMASSIAHQVRQPLAAIITNASACARWLARKPRNLAEANAAVVRIERDAARASEMITRIRGFVQRREMQRLPFDLAEVAREALSMADGEIRRHGVTLRVALAPELRLATGDRVHVQQVILNLITNALEAMEPVFIHQRLLVLTVEARSANALHVAVRDSGVGLPRDQHDRIYDAFHTTKPCGMGMGLTISRSIIEAHHGRLWVTDNDGPGVTAHFTLPAPSSC